MKNNIEEVKQEKEKLIQKALKCLKKNKASQIGLILGDILGGALIAAGAIAIILAKAFTPLVLGLLFSGLIVQSLGVVVNTMGDKYLKKAKDLTTQAEKLEEVENSLLNEEKYTKLNTETKKINKVKICNAKLEEKNDFELLN